MLQLILPALAQGAVSALGGIASGNAAAKQSRLAMIQHAMTEKANREAIDGANFVNREFGANLLATPLNHQVSSEVKGSVDYEGLMKAAEASGINPITFIRNGGLAAFAKQNTSHSELTTGHNAAAAYQLMSPTIFQGSAGPQQVLGDNASAIWGGVQAGLNTFMDQFNRQNTQNFQMDLLNRQLQGQQANTMLRNSFYTPGFATSGSIRTSAGTGGLSGEAVKPTMATPEFMNPHPWGAFMKVDPTQPSMDAVTNAYGEPAEYLFFPAHLANNLLYTLTGSTFKDRSDWWRDLNLRSTPSVNTDALGNVIH